MSILVKLCPMLFCRLLDKIVAGNYFILACALVRALEAIGESAVVTASFVIVASVFPDSVASTFVRCL